MTPLLALAACGGSGDEPAAQADAGAGASAAAPSGGTVGVKLLAFDPEEVRVSPGDTVTWKLGDGIRHVLVQGEYAVGTDDLRTSEKDDGTFSLELKKKGDAVSHTYDKAGTFTYYCTIHKGMNGSVVVG